MEASFSEFVGGNITFYINECEFSEHGILEKVMTKKFSPSRDGQKNLFQDCLQQTYSATGLVVSVVEGRTGRFWSQTDQCWKLAVILSRF